MRQVARVPSADQVAEEWRRRAERDGWARVMRASQPPALAAEVTTRTRQLIAGYLANIAPVGVALEIGCGMGRITPTIATHARSVLAVDMTARMLDLARVNCADLSTVDFQRTSVQELPYGDKRFDVAVCVWVLMHVLDNDDVALACRNIAAAARHLVLVEYEHADIPVGEYSRSRDLDEYLAMLPGSRLVRRQDLHYGGDRSFAALIALEDGR